MAVSFVSAATFVAAPPLLPLAKGGGSFAPFLGVGTRRDLRCPRHALLPLYNNNRNRATSHPRCTQQTPPPPPPSPTPSEAEADEKAQREASAMTAAGATLILKHAAKAYVFGGRRPSRQVLRESILQLERVQKLHGTPVDLERLLGQWRLVFITPKEKPTVLNSLFFPIRAHQTIYRFPVENSSDNDDDKGGDVHSDVEIGEFDNGVFLLRKSLFFRVIGPMRFVPRAQRLEFSVDKLKVKLGPFEWVKDGLDEDGYTLKGRTVKKLPFFTFCCVRDDIAVARGRTGGLALYTRVSDDDML